MRFLPLIVGSALLAAACTAAKTADSGAGETIAAPILPPGQVQDFGVPPKLLTGPLAPDLAAAIAQVFGPSLEDGFFDVDDRSAFDTMGASGDVRVAWLLSDLLRFVSGEDTRPRIARAASDVMGVDLGGDWQAVTDHLMAWDVPAPPNYFEQKKVAVHHRAASMGAPVRRNQHGRLAVHQLGRRLHRRPTIW